MKIEGDFKYVPIREIFGLERFGLERGNCIYTWQFTLHFFLCSDAATKWRLKVQYLYQT